MRFIGDGVAAVAAVDEDTAINALELIEVEYEPLEPIFDPEEALLPDSPQIHAGKPDAKPGSRGANGNITKHVRLEFGKVDAELASSDVVMLIWDLEHPGRFHMIFTRPQWKSWLVRGGFITGGFAIVLAAHFVASVIGAIEAQRLLAFAGGPLAILTAVYTAYLFAQAKGRDLWQNPMAAVQLLVQAVLLGAAALLGDANAWARSADTTVEIGTAAGISAALLWTLGAASIAHLLLVVAETTLAHTTAHARLAAWEMTRGTYRSYFWAGTLLVALAAAAPWLGGWTAIAALMGVLAHEHAYVQAGQAVPLA